MKNKHIREIWETLPQNFKDPEEFAKYFDTSSSLKEVEAMGYVDFYHKIFGREFYQLVGDPRKKSCLEIGFGGGRLLAPASRLFDKAYGVDIHNSFDMTESYLSTHNVKNTVLLRPSEMNKIPDRSVDFVYSFIVFQHFVEWEDVEFYFKEIERILSLDGAGILYFGNNNRNEDDLYLVDNPDTDEFGASSSLLLKPQFAVNQMSKYVQTLGTSFTTKRPWRPERSNQFYVTFASKNRQINNQK